MDDAKLNLEIDSNGLISLLRHHAPIKTSLALKAPPFEEKTIFFKLSF